MVEQTNLLIQRNKFRSNIQTNLFDKIYDYSPLYVLATTSPSWVAKSSAISPRATPRINQEIPVNFSLIQ